MIRSARFVITAVARAALAGGVGVPRPGFATPPVVPSVVRTGG